MTDIIDRIDARIRAALESPEVIEAMVAAMDRRQLRRDLTAPIIRYGEVTSVEPEVFTARVRLMEDAAAQPGFTWGEVVPIVGDHVLVRMSVDGADKLIVRIVRRIAPMPARPVFNVVDFGARLESRDDTDAIRAAINAARAAGGGVVFLPGLCGVTDTVLLPSNIILRGAGWGTGLRALEAGWRGSAAVAQSAIVANENWNIGLTVYGDTGIVVEDMLLDYGDLGPDGNFHALHFRSATRTRISRVKFETRANGDAVAGLHVDDFLVEDSVGLAFRNACWDFWEGASNVTLLGNYAESSLTNQIINFNPEWQPNVTRMTVIGNTCKYTGVEASSTANILGPLDVGGRFMQDVIYIGNHMINCNLTIRGDVRVVVVDGNTFDDIKGLPAIFSYTAFGGTPVGLSIRGNIIRNPAISPGNLGVLRVETDSAVIADNICIGGDNAVPFIYTGATNPVRMGNLSDTDGTMFAHLRNRLQVDGTLKASRQIYPGSESLAFQTSAGILQATAIPSNANGNNNDWCISNNGHIYQKVAGAWVQKV